WPEYYDGPYGGLIGRRARLRQTWSAAAALAATALLRDPEADDPFAFARDEALEAALEGADPPADDEAAVGAHPT
ncbi:MAG: glycoside hydrolase 100 family protein, partial [Trueperaceae bacterium]|nr:glycoside hydrolase 100 family protein [Trueperaceae bacterium]